MNRNVVLIGGPDSGKTNYIGRFGIALLNGIGALKTAGTPEEIKYVEEAIAYLHQGKFAPRTDKNLDARHGSLVIPVLAIGDELSEKSSVTVPDISGEIWKEALDTLELDAHWMTQLETANGAVIFLRVLSPLN